jgi:hypothetical protein
MMSRVAPIILDVTEAHTTVRGVGACITIDLCVSSSDEHSDDSSLSSSSSDEDELQWEGDWVTITGRFVSSRYDDCNAERSSCDDVWDDKWMIDKKSSFESR